MLAAPLEAFNAPNDNARRGRRNALAHQVVEVANLLAAGRPTDAVAAVDAVLAKLDDVASPPDWMKSGAVKTQLRNNLLLMRRLMLQQPA